MPKATLQTAPPGGKPSDKPTPTMPSGPIDPTSPDPRPLPIPEYWRPRPLPAAWRSDLSIAQVMAIQKVALDRLFELDKLASHIEAERVFIHAWLATPPLGGASSASP